MTRTLACLCCCLLFAVAAFAQAEPAPLPAASPSIHFERRWPAADPSWFELLIQPSGEATYRSLPHQEEKPPAAVGEVPEPFEISIHLSSRATQRLFTFAPTLAACRPTLDKLKVAFTGQKTLRYQDASGQLTSLTFNYSTSPQLNSTVDLLLGISETISLSETLKFQRRFDKLSLDSTLRHIEELSAAHSLAEPQLLAPILQRLADDPAVMNLARQRARRLLQAAQLEKSS